MIRIPVRKDTIDGDCDPSSKSEKEYILLELQGVLVPRVAESSLTPTKAAALVSPSKGHSQLGMKRSRDTDQNILDGKTIGKLTRVDKTSFTLRVGHSMLLGQLISLPDALHIVKTVGGASLLDGEADDAESKELVYLGVAKEKIVFKTRPRPVA